LPTDIYNFVNTIFDVAALKQSRQDIGLSPDMDNIGRLSDQDLDKAYELIRNISEKVALQEKIQRNMKNYQLQYKKFNVYYENDKLKKIDFEICL